MSRRIQRIRRFLERSAHGQPTVGLGVPRRTPNRRRKRLIVLTLIRVPVCSPITFTNNSCVHVGRRWPYFRGVRATTWRRVKTYSSVSLGVPLSPRRSASPATPSSRNRFRTLVTVETAQCNIRDVPRTLHPSAQCRITAYRVRVSASMICRACRQNSSFSSGLHAVGFRSIVVLPQTRLLRACVTFHGAPSLCAPRIRQGYLAC